MSEPSRRYDPEAEYMATVPATDAQGGALGDLASRAERTYRLEVRVGRLEFACHPLMAG